MSALDDCLEQFACEGLDERWYAKRVAAAHELQALRERAAALERKTEAVRCAIFDECERIELGFNKTCQIWNAAKQALASAGEQTKEE